MEKKSNFWLRNIASSLMICASSASAIAAETYTQWAAITEIEAGWVQDTMAVQHAGPIVNPDGCRLTGGGYATAPSDPGHSLFHTIILSALMNRKEVRLLISGCIFDKPRIIAVATRP